MTGLASPAEVWVVLAMVAGMGVWWRLYVTGKANR